MGVGVEVREIWSAMLAAVARFVEDDGSEEVVHVGVEEVTAGAGTEWSSERES